MDRHAVTPQGSSFSAATAVLEPPKRDELHAQVREAHRSFPTGVTVVTTHVQGVPVGLAVNAFSSVSMEPPLVLVCVNSSSQSHSSLSRSRHLGISVLGRDQAQLALAFAKSGGDKFHGVDWHSGTEGTPLLDGASATFEVDVQEHIAAGTHTIFLGRVVAVESTGKPPLVYSGGQFYDGARLVVA